MKKQKVKATVLKEEEGYSVFALVSKNAIFSDGENFDQLKTNFIEALNLTYMPYEISYTIDEISFSFDIQSFFDFYKIINAKVLAERIGMNQSLLSQYIKGVKKPSSKQTNKIFMGIQKIGEELMDARLIVH